MESNRKGFILGVICGAIVGNLMIKLLGLTAVIIIAVVLIAIFGIACWLCR